MSLGYLTGLSDPAVYSDRLFAQSGRLAFDVGANAGWVTKQLADRFEEVVAFEPAEESFAALSLATQHLPTIIPVQAAVSDHSGKVTLSETFITEKWGELVTGATMPDWGDHTGTREVPCITLDDCLLAYGGPDLVKIDVEGHEVHVLEGARLTIMDARPQWWIEVHGAVYEQPLRDLLYDYQIEIIRNNQHPEGSEGWHRHFYMVALP
jgi:FkbM family methyltransferase